MDAAAERLALAYLSVYMWPLRWLGVGEAWARRLGRALVVFGVLSVLLFPVSQAPLEAFLNLLLLPQRVPRLLAALPALCALG